jgi:hypothetical protein
MASKTITSLTAGTAPTGAELLAVTQGGNSRRLSTTQMNAAIGTSFPGSPATNDRFYRTDRSLEYFYDGTRWLTTTLYVERFNYQPSKVTTFNEEIGVPNFGQQDMYITSFATSVRTNIAPASNYFDINIIVRDNAGADGTIATLTASGANGAVLNEWRNIRIAVNALVPSDSQITYLNFVEVGTASQSFVPSMQYRLVG